jgi:hypothetical protein
LKRKIVKAQKAITMDKKVYGMVRRATKAKRVKAKAKEAKRAKRVKEKAILNLPFSYQHIFRLIPQQQSRLIAQQNLKRRCRCPRWNQPLARPKNHHLHHRKIHVHQVHLILRRLHDPLDLPQKHRVLYQQL